MGDDVSNACAWRWDGRRITLAWRAGRECISLLAAARTPHKVAISDGLAGHRRLQLDCHVLAQFGEISSYASSGLSANEKGPQYFHAQNPVAAAGDVWYYQKKRAERKNRKSVLGRLKDRVLRFIR